MDAREAILTRVRAARPATTVPRADAPAPTPFTREPAATCITRFLEEASAIGVECFHDASAEAVRERVRALLEGRRVLTWNPDQLPYGLAALVSGATFGDSPRDEQAAADVGLTGCDAALAETGSLAMISAPGRSRAVSLLPPHHVAVVRPEDLRYSMGEFFADFREPLAQAASCTFITGPSRTADIELTLTLGIHGPGRVTVVIGP